MSTTRRNLITGGAMVAAVATMPTLAHAIPDPTARCIFCHRRQNDVRALVTWEGRNCCDRCGEAIARAVAPLVNKKSRPRAINHFAQVLFRPSGPYRGLASG